MSESGGGQLGLQYSSASYAQSLCLTGSGKKETPISAVLPESSVLSVRCRSYWELGGMGALCLGLLIWDGRGNKWIMVHM
jgi:hypothetical protein